MLAELSTKEISEVQNPESFDEHIDVARQGGSIALNARLELERKTGKSVVTPCKCQRCAGVTKRGIGRRRGTEREREIIHYKKIPK